MKKDFNAIENEVDKILDIAEQKGVIDYITRKTLQFDFEEAKNTHEDLLKEKDDEIKELEDQIENLEDEKEKITKEQDEHDKKLVDDILSCIDKYLQYYPVEIEVNTFINSLKINPNRVNDLIDKYVRKLQEQIASEFK